ncbi:M15 family metallopeptidase [Paenibacillus sp. GCM10023250]|uniref:M15 family metallopeptidase n=1 Tax=Paenibacillus sp. GCM10023250 TaxID=3252648 RepID=UPI00360E9A60
MSIRMPGWNVPVPARPGLRREKKRSWLLPLMLVSLAGLIVLNSPLKDRLLPRTDAVPGEPLPPVTSLHPVVAAKMMDLIKRTSEAGIVIMITDGFRSKLEQDVLYEQGRSAKGRIVTNAKGGTSYHNYGLAIDFALRTPQGDVIWDMKYDGNKNGKADWQEVAAAAKSLGFAWGGDWKSFKDYPHLQMDFGYSIDELKRGKYPPDDAKP